MKKKLAIVITHPIQYHAPLYRRIAARDLFDLHVFYHNDRGVRPYFDNLAGQQVSYDNDLLSGYSCEFLSRGEPKNRIGKFRRALLRNLEDRLLACHPDAVYFHGYNFWPHLRSLRRLRQEGVRVFYRGENEDVLPRPAWRNVMRELLLARCLPRFDAILYIGKENRDFFLRRGVPEHKLFFVPYSADNTYFGIDFTQQARLEIRARVCRERGIDPNSVIFVNTCKHRVEKRPLDLLEAYALARREIEPAIKSTLLLVGDGPLNRQMRARAQQAGIPDVIFTGFVTQSKMRELLLAADYCVNPAEEPWGCVFNEALPAGLGLISSDRVVGWPDLVRNGVNGFVYHCGDIPWLAALLRDCVRHPKWIRPFSCSSKEIARLYSYDTCVEGLRQALDRTCVQNRSHPITVLHPERAC